MIVFFCYPILNLADTLYRPVQTSIARSPEKFQKYLKRVNLSFQKQISLVKGPCPMQTEFSEISDSDAAKTSSERNSEKDSDADSDKYRKRVTVNAVDLKEMILKSEVNSQRLIRHARSNGLIIYESNKLGKVFN